jgi:alkylation response protein AidB-like acyl-CoA dehydrogenase
MFGLLSAACVSATNAHRRRARNDFFTGESGKGWDIGLERMNPRKISLLRGMSGLSDAALWLSWQGETEPGRSLA